MYEISVEVNGKIYKGTYEVRSKMIFVSSAYGSKTTQIGGMPQEALAKMLLREILRESRK